MTDLCYWLSAPVISTELHVISLSELMYFVRSYSKSISD